MKALIVGLAVCMAGCVTLPATPPSAVVTSAVKRAVVADRAKDAVEAGKSSKADVAAALGETLVIRFDTGYEVWVYDVDSQAPRAGDKATSDIRAEFVILFRPSGLVAKTRVRTVPPG